MKTTDSQILTLFFRADMYRMLALALDLPTLQTTRVVAELATDLLESNMAGEMDRELLSHFLAVARVTTQEEQEDIEGHYHRLFTTQVDCPPSEGSYHRTERGPIIGDVTAFYRAFQFQAVAEKGPPDEMKMELAFMSVVALKEANAHVHSLNDEAVISREAQCNFLNDHVGRWMPRFCSTLQQHATHPFYLAVAALVKAWITQDCQNFELSPHPLPISLPQADDAELQCATE